MTDGACARTGRSAAAAMATMQTMVHPDLVIRIGFSAG
jgi:predicted NBD/HSP70 family sugar kinase